MNRETLVRAVLSAVALGPAMPLWADGSVRFTGTLTMAVDHFDPGAFGLTVTEMPPGQPLLPPFESHFSVAFIGGGQPDPSNDSAILEDFELTIGNTSWDETMPYTDLRVLAQDYTVLGMQIFFTETKPEHPDLAFFLPSSPGIWEAHDLVNGIDRGKIGGTYSISGTAVPVPQPASLALLTIGLTSAVFGVRRRRAGMSSRDFQGRPLG